MDERILGGKIKYGRGICDREAERENSDVSQDNIDNNTPEDGLRKGVSSVPDLL